ncbi:hypothetical protein ACLB1Q_35110 [Escherichia coli]
MIAIHPVTLEVNILAEALAVDHDLAAYQGEFIKPLRKPISTEFATPLAGFSAPEPN